MEGRRCALQPIWRVSPQWYHLEMQVKEILLENHFSRNKSLEDVLLQPMQQDFLRESGGYNVKYGLDYILKRIYCGDRDRELIKNSTVDLMLSNMCLLPSGMVSVWFTESCLKY